MKMQYFRELTFSAGLLLVTMPTSLCAQNSDMAATQKRIAALRQVNLPDGLHKAALANGGKIEVGGQAPPMNRAAGLADLTAASSLIVVLRVTSSKTDLVQEGRDLETSYSAKVVQTIKGQSSPTLSVAIAGGSYKFPDGSVASETETLCRPLTVGNEYLVFLIPSNDRSNVYYPTNTCQATFEVAPDGTHVTSHTYLADDQLRDNAKLGKRALIQKVEALVTSK